MLRQLYIRNFTLIDELDIDFREGFSVITGETGAGKSIILGAIGLLLGNRADLKTIKAGKDKCVVEAHFDISLYPGLDAYFKENDIDNDTPTDCILRREVNSNGKSRAFINDTPVALSTMRDIGHQLVDIHSQHQNLLLAKEDFQLEVLDIIAGDEELFSAYQQAFTAYRQAKAQLQETAERIERDRVNEDFMRFQLNELDTAALMEGEQEELEQEVNTLEHVEEIKSSLYNADQLLSSSDSNVVQNLRQTVSYLRDITAVYSDVEELVSRLDSVSIEVKDVADEIAGRVEQIDFDPQRLEKANSRLDEIYSLQRKYHVETVEELLAIRTELHHKLSMMDNSSEELASLKELVNRCEAECRQQAEKLSKVRKQAARRVEDEMRPRLVQLGIPHVAFDVSITDKPLSVNGRDKVCFMFSANKDIPQQPISEVASGGEIARVMLSLKALISGTAKLPTIIFDEIDTGVSGRVAEKMAEIMKEMGDMNRQVISITHLPQIAAMGSTHYKVIKEDGPQGTSSRMIKLAEQDRVNEIAQMLSGSQVSEAAIANAKTLLKMN